jgi:hypothetical protein
MTASLLLPLKTTVTRQKADPTKSPEATFMMVLAALAVYDAGA